MKRRPPRTVVTLGAGIALLSFCLLPLIADAYAVGGTPEPITIPTSSGTDVFGALTAPFRNFMNSFQWSGGGVTVPASGVPTITGNPRSVLQPIDDWFAQNIGVTFSNIAHAVLSVLAWVLDLARRLVDWLLGIF